MPAGVLAREAGDFVREVAGRVALELAATPQGRAAHLSVEVSPSRGVELQVRKAHELRVFVEVGDGAARIAWQRRELEPSSRGIETSRGTLGEAQQLGAEDLRVLMEEWLETGCR